MVNLSDENRDLLLSLYIDGELDPEQAKAVGEKIQQDDAWRQEYALLRKSETRITKVVEENWHDEDFSAAVRDRVLRMPPPSAPLPKDSGFRLWWTLGLAVLVAGGAIALFHRPATPAKQPTGVIHAKVLSGKVLIDDGSAAEGAVLKSQSELAAVDSLVTLRWVDGTHMWLRKSTVVNCNSDGGPDFWQGRALIQTPASEKELCVTSPAGANQGKISLRTGLFDVEVTSNGLKVNVFSGSARVQGGTVAEKGSRLNPSGSTVRCDARVLSARWGDVRGLPEAGGIQWPPIWSQAGGGADHSGLTPVSGPATLTEPRLRAITTGRQIKNVSPATVAGDGSAYVAWQIGAEEVAFSRLGEAEDDATVLVRMTGKLIGSPVITPSGLVLAATTGKLLRAESRSGKVWEKDLGSGISAVSALPNGTILCCTFQRLVALDENGHELWSYRGMADFQPPVALCPDGSLLAISRSKSGKAVFLTSDGKELKERTLDLSPHAGPFGIPVIQQDGSVIMTSSSGEAIHGPASAFPALTVPDALTLTAPPLGNGACAVGHEIVFANGTRIFSPDQETIIAMAGDGEGRLYTASRKQVYLLDRGHNKSATDPDCWSRAPVKQGQVVPGGLAVGPGKLYVATTAGVLVFEE